MTSLRFMLRWWPAHLVLLASLAAPRSTEATVVVDVPLEQMVAESDLVVLGTVEATGSRLLARDGQLTPVTETRVRVLRWLKGAGGRTVAVTTPGGRHPRGERHAVGAPRFRPGEQVLLFLRRRGAALVPFGFALGAYRIERGRGAVPARVARQEDGLVIAERRDGKLVLRSGPEPAMPLEAFLDRVEALVRAGEGGPP